MITKQPKTEGYNAKYYHQHKEIGEMFGLSGPVVSECRKRFLQSKIDGILEEIRFFLDYQGSLDSEEYALILASDLGIKAAKLRLEIIRLDMPERKGTVTDEMMEFARNSPVEKVVEFVRGKAFAFCHQDKTPSLTFMNKTGRAWCPACNKYYNAVDILVKRDGLSFLQAVKTLYNDA